MLFRSDINKANAYGHTPLWIAVYSKKVKVVKYLIKEGAVKYLVENCGDVNNRNKHGYTPLYVARLAGHLEVVKYLELKGAK